MKKISNPPPIGRKPALPTPPPPSAQRCCSKTITLEERDTVLRRQIDSLVYSLADQQAMKDNTWMLQLGEIHGMLYPYVVIEK